MKQSSTKLVAQGYTQVEWIDYDETFAPIAHLKFLYILHVISYQLNVKLYQMDVKSVFINVIL
jgi:hypothetical protein